MTAIKEIPRIKITDEYGMDFQSAVAIIFNSSETTQRTLAGNEETNNYDESEDIKSIAYEVNYWYDPSKKAAGFRSRPLAVDNGKGGFTRVLEVDLTLAAVINILEGTLSHNDKILQAAQTDLTHRSA
tara:strand:- start:252 stop:635 length:384 start_codon:yes stop_codon:yes gene_type:complete